MVTTLYETFDDHLRPTPTGCLEWTRATNADGYGQVWVPERQRVEQAHRVAWELANGPIPDGLHTLHRCDNPPCCNVDHLFLGTRSDNMRDKVAKGRWSGGDRRGEKQSMARLTEAQVLDIRARYAAGGVTQRALAVEFGVGYKQISRIILRIDWKHV